jgi:hypothetical protein
MLLSLFLEHLKRTKTLSHEKVFCFFGAANGTYPLLFFYHFLDFFKRNNQPIYVLSCASDIVLLKTALSMLSFSGSVTYWLDHFHGLSDKNQQEMLAYLKAYDGPHRVVFFTDKITEQFAAQHTQAHMQFIDVSRTITPQDFTRIRFLVSDHLQEKSTFAAHIGMYADYLSLDTLCLFAHYELLLGKNSDEFFLHWITRIIDPTSSLFLLSQHFFSKKPKLFFRQWATVADQYLPPFWATFWADQLWRAYMYVDLMQQKKYADAKKVQYKLPFSFINRDWSRYDLAELANAHNCLMNIDFKLKNGSSEIGLEYFYNEFFEGDFQ